MLRLHRLALAALISCVPLLHSQEGSPMLPQARVSVDSVFSGYGKEVLSDGAWVELGKETTAEYGHADALGNKGNSWVSARNDQEHWVRLDWDRPLRLDHVTVWWTKPEWFPAAFRVEVLQDQSWVGVHGSGVWFTARSQSTTLGFAPQTVQALRVIQHAAPPGKVALMAVQEVLPAFSGGNSDTIDGAVQLTEAELAQYEGQAFVSDVAALHRSQPGASTAYTWSESGQRARCMDLVDGDVESPADIPPGTRYVGVVWPIQHVIDTAELVCDGPPGDALEVETFDGQLWQRLMPIEASRSDHRTIGIRFAPVATSGLRIRRVRSMGALRGLRVLRHRPENPRSWPDELIDRSFERQVLAEAGEPSFERLASAALSMRPARALLGLKDSRETVGVRWDGTLLSRRGTLTAAYGDGLQPLEQVPDTVTWRLIDGWRPGVTVSGQIGDLGITQTAMVIAMGGDPAAGWLGWRLELTRSAEHPEDSAVWVALETHGEGSLTLDHGALVQGGKVVLASADACRYDARTQRARFSVSFADGPTQVIHLWQPLGDVPAQTFEIRTLPDWDTAMQSFRRYWDEALSELTAFELPEPRVQNMVRAVLTQLALCGEGDIMYYGAYPSAYARKLYGIEESYAMFALAYWGLEADAERYMNGTYLTRDFLAKVPAYETYAHRHQQYRNGLQPHFAVALYRLTGNEAWIRPHLPLLRECAEWTLSERRKTMDEAPGEERPLHWGLLPKWSYGGDIAGMQCYALYANAACLKGLEDTAWLLSRFGDAADAQRYAEQADKYRKRLLEVMPQMVIRNGDVPFLPLRLYADSPVEHDYYQLFAGVLLGLGAFDPNGAPVSWITRYMEESELLFCGLPRFRRDVGAGGLDALYGWGYLKTLLQQGRTEEYLLGFYAYLAYNLERDTFASRETNLLYTNDRQWYLPFRVPDISDPVPCSSAVALLLLRHMLISETRGDDPAPQGKDPGLQIHLLKAAPRAWFRDGAVIRWHGAPTEAGPLSCDVRSSVSSGLIEVQIEPPRREAWSLLRVRIPHPDGRPAASVHVNGAPWQAVDTETGQIDLTPGPDRFTIQVRY